MENARDRWDPRRALAWLGWLWVLPALEARAEEACASCCEPQAKASADAHFEADYVVSVAGLPRVDGWDEYEGHRSGWGMTAGIDLSPWQRDTEVHTELTYLTNREDRLVSFDLGLKVPFHRGLRWDVHGVTGPALAYDRHSRTLEDGEREVERSFVVGMIAGIGTAYWFHTHLGATLDVNYRVLGGEGIAHRLFTALGMAARW